MLYHSLPDEVDTHRFVEKWSAQKRVLLPQVVGDDLCLRRYTSAADMAVGAYGILEPVGELFTDYDSISLVVVPGVAFDAAGNRLGRGKGYYDRLLPRLPRARRIGICLAAAYKIGICFPFQLVDRVPAEPFDIRMDEIISQ